MVKKTKKQKIFIVSIILALAQLLAGIIAVFWKKNKENIKKFAEEEKREIKELVGRRETGKKFYQDSLKLFKDFFIPHEGNNHNPHSLRPKALATYLTLAIIIKIFATGLLFFIYPSPAKMAYIVSSEIIELTNQDRIANGLLPLKINPELTRAATAKGADMLSRGYFAHDTPDGTKPWEWINKQEFDYVYAGENLAMDFTRAQTIEEAFMDSPTHRKNILNPKYQEVGVAVVSGKMNDHETDILVVYFGTQRLALAGQESVKLTETKISVAPAIINETVPPTIIAQSPAVQETVQSAAVEIKKDSVIADVQSQDKPVVLINRTQSAVLSEQITLSDQEGIVEIKTEERSGDNLANKVMEYANIIFIAFIIFIVVSLLLNIFIKINIQHYHTILQSVVVLALIASLVISKLHFIEKIASELKII